MAQSGLAAEQFLIKVLKTSGDTIKGDLKDFGGKGLFTRELEIALLEERIDLAVHSMKDVPTVGHQELCIPAILERADVRDAFISETYNSLADLPQGALIGSASIRRRAQLSALRPDLKFCLLRGNVGTRLRKLSEGVCDATMLACAGLRRLGQEDVITEAIETDIMLPAPAQGAIGIECRKADEDCAQILRGLNHTPTELAITAERGLLRALDGSCRTPIAAFAKWDGDELSLRGQVLAKDGTYELSKSRRAVVAMAGEAYDLGFGMGSDMRLEIGDRVLWDE